MKKPPVPLPIEPPYEILDCKGLEIYRVYSDGEWALYDYDSNGNETYYKDCDGMWAMRRYDECGKEIYFENSFGTVQRFGLTILEESI